MSPTIFFGTLSRNNETRNSLKGMPVFSAPLNELIKTDYRKPYNCIISGKNYGTLSILTLKTYDNAGLITTKNYYFLLSSIGFLGILN